VENTHQIDELMIVEFEAAKVAALEAGAKAGQAIAQAVMFARNLVNQPPNYLFPADLAEAARKMAEAAGIGVQILEEAELRKLDMGALLGVTQGSDAPCKFVILDYKPAGTEEQAPLIFVGKGVTFDTGGISIKPSEKMDEMKSDMGGAAAVIGALQAIATLGLSRRVIGITPLVENMPDGKAYRPGDVLRASNGKTIEVISTDAEGRLILADALVYAGRYKPAAVVDLATLTGACVVALGEDVAAGMFGTDDALKQRLMGASGTSGERLWPMPLWEDYKDRIKSDTADMKNSGGRYGGVGTSAWFLREFAEGYPWAHLDIAPMALSERDRPYMPKGATGFGVRLLVQLARDWAS
jgi:leucyl aminopeptidase